MKTAEQKTHLQSLTDKLRAVAQSAGFNSQIILTPALRSSREMVHEFNATYGISEAEVPCIENAALNVLTTGMLKEELQELIDALNAGDATEVLDALADLQYVLDGAVIRFGFARVIDAAVAEVHRSNMSKLGEDGKPIFRADGKIMKGPKFSEPNLKPLVDWLKQ